MNEDDYSEDNAKAEVILDKLGKITQLQGEIFDLLEERNGDNKPLAPFYRVTADRVYGESWAFVNKDLPFIRPMFADGEEVILRRIRARYVGDEA